MKTMLSCVLRFCLFLTVAFASTTSAKVTQSAAGYFQCEMEAGMFNREDVGTFANGNILAGRIRVLEEKTRTQWPGMVAFWFELGTGDDVGVTVGTWRNDPGHVYVLAARSHRSSWKYDLIAKWPRNAWVPVKAEIDSKGYLIVSSGDFSKRLKIGRRTVRRRVIHCQSGSFEVDLRPPGSEPIEDLSHYVSPSTREDISG